MLRFDRVLARTNATSGAVGIGAPHRLGPPDAALAARDAQGPRTRHDQGLGADQRASAGSLVVKSKALDSADTLACPLDGLVDIVVLFRKRHDDEALFHGAES